MIYETIKKLYDPQCVRIAGVVGTGIHLYSQAINNQHFQGVYEDFANGEYLRGTLKAIVPLALPYAVSYFVRKKTQKEAKRKIGALENIIIELKTQNEQKSIL
ncbi:MAG: hypothetical protein ACP5NV_01850 [Candidatus Woesearchaeota archaeon]